MNYYHIYNSYLGKGNSREKQMLWKR